MNQVLFLGTQTCLGPFMLDKSTLNTHTSLRSLAAWPNIQSNNFYMLIFHENIRYIKSMIRYVRSISIKIRNMVSCFVVLFHLMRVAFGELYEFLTIVVHT
jgi:hypothetical protein